MLIQQMNALMARFFWGKGEQGRYLAPVAWKKVCKPVEEGGLGVKDLSHFGEALFLKLVWAVASQEDKLWVQVCKAKYCPRVGFWKANPSSHCSKLWRDILARRGLFADSVGWKIGDGSTIHAVGQPWFQGWERVQQGFHNHTKFTVKQLIIPDTGQWRGDILASLFDPLQIQNINNIQPGIISGGVAQDKLVWQISTKGSYRVKEGYTMLKGQSNLVDNSEEAKLWVEIQKWKGIIPKVKLFLWRLINKALMTSQNVHRRIAAVSPMCQRCHTENEFESHCFFFCQGSRVVWFGSALGLRSQDMPLNVVIAISQCTQYMTQDQRSLFCYTLWEIWLARNELILNQGKFDPEKILRKAQSWLQVGFDQGNVRGLTMSISPSNQERYKFQQNGYQLLIDGSWDCNHRAGFAYLLYFGGKLLEIGYFSTSLHDAFQAEVLALKQALKKVIELQIQNCAVQFFSDCSSLVLAVNDNDPDNSPSWRSREDLCEVIALANQIGGNAMIGLVRRESVHHAHLLANMARRTGACYQGMPRCWVAGEQEIPDCLDITFFQRVQEDPP
ncbi:RNA-directed DNA polymerase (reverse transcriptase)-related family protein [Rhynchospora pubera]|uniref:RNA-directed DNA polymerase (Reverse transcriptase)-related family protein n=1 Tax=Rhynchospora pubera TaxID=906938 RepID=A0AAV8EAQ5_9POAL|nr:RNA-directed DNA polymerase (reverse transcriptase)-related family protein [Rhynchospora pubera]